MAWKGSFPSHERESQEDLIQQLLLILHLLPTQDFTGIAILSGEKLQFRYANSAFIKLAPLSIAPDHMDGTPYAEAILSGETFPPWQDIHQALQSPSPLFGEWVFDSSSEGGQCAYSVGLVPIRWENKPSLMFLIQDQAFQSFLQSLSFDLSLTLAQKIEMSRAVMMAMADVLILLDPSGRITRVNQAALDVFDMNPVGMTIEELAQKFSIHHPGGADRVLTQGAIMNALVNRDEKNNQEVLLVMQHSAQERIFLASTAPLRNESNGMLIGAVSIWHDVSTREHLLEQLALEQSRLLMIIEHAPEAILVLDADGRVVIANPAVHSLFGSLLTVGESYEALDGLHINATDGKRLTVRTLPPVVAALDGIAFSNEELLITLPSEDKRHVLVSAAPILDRKGGLGGAVSIWQDVTLRRRADEELRTQASRSQLLAALSQSFAEAGLNYAELLQTIVEPIGELSGDMCAIELYTLDGEWSYLAAFYHSDSDMREQVMRYGEGNIHYAATQTPFAAQIQNTLSLMDASLDEQRLLLPVSFRSLLDYFPIPNALILPLRAHGRRLGYLALMRDQMGRRFSMQDQFFYQDLADRAALALEDARLYEEEARRARELYALNQATATLLSTLELEVLLIQILDAAQLAIPSAEQGALYLSAPDTGALEIRAMMNFRDLRLRPFPNPFMQPYVARVLSEKTSLLIHSIPENLPATGQNDSNQPRSAIITPLRMEQRVLGVISLTGSRPHLFQDSDLRLLDSFALTATAAIRNATLYAEVQRLATIDPLTGVFNRYRFFELGEMEIQRFRRLHIPLSAIMFDLDNFKLVNDTYGHSAGDQVLVTVAKRVRNIIRTIDIFGRYGGDEFSILLPATARAEAIEIAQRIRRMIAEDSVQTFQGDIELSISLGVTQAENEEETLSSILARADAALYSAKNEGRNQVASY